MISRRMLVMDIFSNIIYLLFFYGLLAAPVVFLFDSIQIDVLFYLMALVIAYFFIIRRVVKPVVPMVLAHIAVPFIAVYFSTGLFYVITYLIMTVILTAFSIFQRYKKTFTFSSEFVFFAPVIFVILTIIAGYMGHGYIVGIYTVLIIAVTVGAKLHIRMYHVSTSLEVIAQNSTQPVQKILAFDYKAMALFGVALTGLILLINRLFIRPILALVSRLMPNIQFEHTPDPTTSYLPPPPMFEGPALPPELMDTTREPFLIWRFLEFIFFYVLMPLVALGLVIMLFLAIRKFLRKLRHNNNQNPELADGHEDIKEFIRTPKTRHKRRNLRGEHGIRKLFRETVAGYIKKGVPIQKSDTPLQIAGKITSEDITGLANEYSSVRYKG